MNAQSYLLYSITDKRIYESIDSRIPDRCFLDSVIPLLPLGWKTFVGGFWTQVAIPGLDGIKYGWKIHISVAANEGHEVLCKVLPCIIKNNVCFKFLSDEFALRLSLNKNMPRMQVGKFITIYPKSPEQCRLISEELVRLTKGHAGPYILTDQPVGESKNIYVRFGAHIADYKLNQYGIRIPGYHNEDGCWQVDVRSIPDADSNSSNSNDHSGTNTAGSNIDSIRIGGHYLIKKAIRYNGEGGIYHGIDDRTNMPIIVREQRRGAGSFFAKSNAESGYAIKKEARLLQIAEKSGFTPRYIGHFEEGEHWFLVQERLIGSNTLWGYFMDVYYDSSHVTGKEIFEHIKSLFVRIASGLQSIHSHGVILRDLTRTNVLVTEDGHVKFIDLEFAHEIGDESPWVPGWTPGYGSPQQKNGDTPTTEDDCYAFGVLLLEALTFCASGLELDRASVLRKLRRNLHDLMLPVQLEDIILGLMNKNPDNRWNLEQAIHALKSISFAESDIPVFPTAELQGDIKNRVDNAFPLCNKILVGIDEFLQTSATHARHDRLWPASPQVWTVNPVCIGYGAGGVALYQQKSGTLGSQTLNWIVERTSPDTCPPSLFVGMAGVAWLLVECGELIQAKNIMSQAWDISDDVGSSLYFGLAGLGLVELKLFQKTGDREHLIRAEEVAFKIQAQSHENEDGVHWITSGQIKLGFSEGPSGVALFFLYLYCITSNIHYLAFGRKALDFDLAQRVDANGQILWHQCANASPNAPKTPHLWAGTAGVGAVLLRYYFLTQELGYGALLSKLSHTISSRFSNKIWQCEGLSGMVEFHLDMAHFFPEHRHKHELIAWHLAEGIMDHALRLDEKLFKGVAFAGIDHVRICADYGYGTAGIALCLHRLRHGGDRSLFLDEILRSYLGTKYTKSISEAVYEN